MAAVLLSAASWSPSGLGSPRPRAAGRSASLRSRGVPDRPPPPLHPLPPSTQDTSPRHLSCGRRTLRPLAAAGHVEEMVSDQYLLHSWPPRQLDL